MNTRSYALQATLWLASAMLYMASASCTFAAGTVEPEPPDITPSPQEDVPTSQVQATATESEQSPLETATDAPPAAPTATAGPLCTVLQDLNLRTGPGTAYHPPITTLPANTKLIPLAYNPVGTPSDNWVQVRNPINQQVGWVRVRADLVSCDIDLTTLASVAVDPPVPQRPRAETSAPDGSCGEGGVPDELHQHVYDCDVRLSDGIPVQFLVFRDGAEADRDEGVQSVVFRVEQNGTTVYTNTEEAAAYCMFGGDSPCSTWVLEDFVYKWQSGGDPIQPGEYIVNIDANLDDPFVVLHWDAVVTITRE